MKDAKWSYLAGLIDGEGHIGITKGCRYWRNKDGVETKYPAYSLQVSVANNSRSLMAFLIKHFGGVYYTHTRINPNAREGYTWQPKGAKNKAELLLSVLPYLVIKVEQAKMALEFLRMSDEINPEKRETLHAMSLRLNRRGVSPTTNTPDDSRKESKIESDLMGDHESELAVTQVSQTQLDEAETASVALRKPDPILHLLAARWQHQPGGRGHGGVTYHRVVNQNCRNHR